MKVDLIPAFDDNYIFALVAGDRAMVVDPGSAREVFRYIGENDLKLESILLTHHHGDHIGGVEELRAQTGANVMGPSDLAKYGVRCDVMLKDGVRFAFSGIEFETYAVPGHTLDHLAFFAPKERILFCGDTLFSLGCGRLFEGTFEQMHGSLARLRALPPDTKVYCAHEYTLTNARFSLRYLEGRGASPAEVDAYKNLIRDLEVRRARGEPTIPSSLAFENRYNLFLNADTLERFKDVRQARNAY